MILENVESRKLFSLFAYPKFNQPYSSFFFFSNAHEQEFLGLFVTLMTQTHWSQIVLGIQ